MKIMSAIVYALAAMGTVVFLADIALAKSI